jgi:hypothetical protein
MLINGHRLMTARSLRPAREAPEKIQPQRNHSLNRLPGYEQKKDQSSDRRLTRSFPQDSQQAQTFSVSQSNSYAFRRDDIVCPFFGER